MYYIPLSFPDLLFNDPYIQLFLNVYSDQVIQGQLLINNLQDEQEEADSEL